MIGPLVGESDAYARRSLIQPATRTGSKLARALEKVLDLLRDPMHDAHREHDPRRLANPRPALRSIIGEDCHGQQGHGSDLRHDRLFVGASVRRGISLSFAKCRPKGGGMARLRELDPQQHVILAQAIMEPARVYPVLLEPVSDLSETDSKIPVVKSELDRIHVWQSQ